MSQTASLSGPQKSGGAPKGNCNRTVHGIRAFAETGRIPVKMRGGYHLRRKLRAMRAELVAEVLAIHGREPSLHDLALIRSATRHEARARLCERYLAIDAESPQQTIRKSTTRDGLTVSTTETIGLSVVERVAILEAIGRATDAADKCLRLLGLDVRPEALDDVEHWRAVDAMKATQAARKAIALPAEINATTSTTEAVSPRQEVQSDV